MSRAGRCGSWPSESWSRRWVARAAAVGRHACRSRGADKRAAVAQELLALVPQEFTPTTQ